MTRLSLGEQQALLTNTIWELIRSDKSPYYPNKLPPDHDSTLKKTLNAVDECEGLLNYRP
ncbi:hypothetical protein E2C01_014294 [Portunus trituberculatus]|uniref:Uncharacterized protein n=1 Tax=Portunus trituberculatus TaxID=210409 RepID=A0A5B7DIE5_PORTR|nr:hypothetical protein [Portunus trituberculatus]